MQGDDKSKDITQEVFIRFIRYLPIYHEEGKILHFLYRIASNLCNDEYRKQNRYRESQKFEEYELVANIDVHEDVLQRCTQEELMYCISKLPLKQQDVIYLHYFQELTFKEIANIYQIPESSIKSRCKAGLLILKKMMEGDNKNE